MLGAGAVAASALLLVGDGIGYSAAGYVLSTLVALTCVTAFRWLDNRRRQNVSYVSSPRLARLGTVVAVGALVFATAHVWNLATGLAS
jgi:hypothetical protein